MLSNTLNTNEIKNSAGTEQEFGRLSSEARATEYGNLTETPSAPHRFSVKHTEIGTGLSKRRRSLIRFDKSVTGQVDTETAAQTSAYIVMDIPIGNLTAYDEPKNVLANLMSFCATTGAGTTVLFDCSGNGATALINGSL
jgi:hypothetical protein